MNAIAGRIIAGALFLMAIPFIVWLTGWRWQPGQDVAGLKIFYWFTQTVTQPWGIVTHLLLCVWFLWCLRPTGRSAIVLVIILSVTVVSGQGIKSLIKQQVREPRPYVLWLEEKHAVPVDRFYAQTGPQRKALVKQQLREDKTVPGWLRKHWQFETGFAFPSGHTMFAACWALLGVGLLWPRRRLFTVGMLCLWAIVVMTSRLLLGMHWPVDLMTSVAISAGLAMIASGLFHKLNS